jgi:glycosyltransferase involved in cell wall biosynthesis
MRALIVSNMFPTPERPALGSFVRDQVRALQRIAGIELELFTFTGGSPVAYLEAARAIRRRYRGERIDIVHAHFGLTAWPARAAPARGRALTLHGTDLAHPRSRLLTGLALRSIDLVATVSEPLAREIPRWAIRRPAAVLPCGVDTHRFQPIPRAQARSELGLDPRGPYLLFPADPARPEKRYDLARAAAGETPLLTLGAVAPEEVPLWVNAANAVLIPSDREGFGLAVLEALACDVPVLATPVGIAPDALANLPGTLCRRFEREAWRAALEPHLAAADPRVAGRSRAEPFSSDRMAARVVEAWERLLSPVPATT